MKIGIVVSAEVWCNVAGFEEIYEVSSHGRVRRKATGRILRPWIAARRYHYLSLRGVNARRKVGVHVLVAEAFHGQDLRQSTRWLIGMAMQLITLPTI